MKITALKAQVNIPGRVNVFVDGKYRFSVDAMQIIDLGIKTGAEYDEEQLQKLIDEGEYSKLYTRSLEYALMRPRSLKEMRDYLYRKTRDTRTKTGSVKKGVSQANTERVLNKLIERNYVNDASFAKFWIENRNVRKGSSLRKLQAELSAKGVDKIVIEEALSNSERSDIDELRKVYEKKRSKYEDTQKLIAYLARQGFRYDDITTVIAEDND